MATVMLVDDNSLVLTVHELMLQDFGHKVISKGDAQSALSLIRAGEDIDLVITDYRMPLMNGIEFIKSLRQILPRVPVIMLTGYYNAAEIEPELDVFKCLSKPIKEKEFDLTIKAALDQTDTSSVLACHH